MSYKKVSAEVFYGMGPVVRVDDRDIQTLVDAAGMTDRKRSRLCTHLAPEHSLHEMLIVHARDAYVRPHRHLGRSESFHVISGEADVVLFDEAGELSEVIKVGPFGSSKVFYRRMAEPIFHSMLIRTPLFVFHEVTSGPFDPVTTEFAAWAPADGGPGVQTYLSDLETRVSEYLKS